MPFKIIEGGLNVDRDSIMRMFVVSHDLYQRIICQKLPLSGERIALNGQVSKMGLVDSFYSKFWAVTSKRASSKARENHFVGHLPSTSAYLSQPDCIPHEMDSSAD
jgi:hypothetical protein